QVQTGQNPSDTRKLLDTGLGSPAQFLPEAAHILRGLLRGLAGLTETTNDRREDAPRPLSALRSLSALTTKTQQRQAPSDRTDLRQLLQRLTETHKPETQRGNLGNPGISHRVQQIRESVSKPTDNRSQRLNHRSHRLQHRVQQTQERRNQPNQMRQNPSNRITDTLQDRTQLRTDLFETVTERLDDLLQRRGKSVHDFRDNRCQLDQRRTVLLIRRGQRLTGTTDRLEDRLQHLLAASRTREVLNRLRNLLDGVQQTTTGVLSGAPDVLNRAEHVLSNPAQLRDRIQSRVQHVFELTRSTPSGDALLEPLSQIRERLTEPRHQPATDRRQVHERLGQR